MNLFCLVGQVTGKPEMKETQSGAKVTTFDLKVQRQFPCSGGVHWTSFFVLNKKE